MQRSALALLLSLVMVACAHAGDSPVDGPGRGPAPSSSCGATLAECLPLGAVELMAADLDSARADGATSLLVAALSPSDPPSFARTFGVDPSSVRRIAFARYEPGELYLLEGDFDASSVVAYVGRRMNTLELSDDAPARRVGFLGVERVDLAAVGPHRLAFAREHGTPMMRLLGRTLGRRVPSVLERMPEGLAQALRCEPIALAFYMPGRFELDTDVGLLFARAEWAIVRLRGMDASDLEIAVTVQGALPVSAEENLRSIVIRLADSELGGVFGIRDGLPTLTVRAASDGARMTMHVDARQVVSAIGIIAPHGGLER